MSDLDRSNDYYEKLERLKENILPTQTEIRDKLGDRLTDVLFETCLPTISTYLGLMPPLKGAGADLWISPSDLLIGKVRLKPPLTSKHVQALTHEGILEIGKVIEKKVRRAFEIEMENAIAEQQLIWAYIAEKEKQAAIAKQKLEDEIRFEHEVMLLKEAFIKQLELELKALEDRLEIEKLAAVEEGKRETERTMQEKLEFTVLVTVYKLTDIFALELLKQSRKMHEHFWYHIREEKKKRRCALEREKFQCQENLRKLRHELECENVANTMYILANERMKCNCEKAAMQESYLGQITELQKELDDRNQALQDYAQENETKTQEIAAREAYLFEIIKQFQKFIYFALRAVPTQAEFLLNIEKLMIFELTTSIIDNKPELIDDILFFSEDASVTSTSHSSNHMPELVVPDCHKCDSIADIPSLAHTLEPEDDLPAFIFNENVYVREDFRNMISQGLEISKNNELWSHAIKHLTQSLQVEKPLPSEQSVTSSDTEPSFMQQRAPLQLSYKQKNSPASVKFSGEKRRASIDNQVRVRHSSMEPIHAKFSEKLLKSHKYDVSPRASYVIDVPHNDVLLVASKIAFTRNSLTLIPPRLRVDQSTDSFSNDSAPTFINAKPTTTPVSTSFILQTHDPPLNRLSVVRSVQSQKSVDIVDCRPKKFDHAVDSMLLVSRKSAESRMTEAKDLLYTSRTSKIEFARNSMDLIQTKMKTKGKGRMSSFERLPDNLRWDPQKKKTIGIQCGGDKKVSISHFEIIPDSIDYRRKTSRVDFNPTPKIIPDSPPFRGVCPLKISSDESTDDFFAKPGQAKVVGDRKLNVRLQKQSDFTLNRVNSFLSIFKQRPSLRMLFTEAIKN